MDCGTFALTDFSAKTQLSESKTVAGHGWKYILPYGIDGEREKVLNYLATSKVKT